MRLYRIWRSPFLVGSLFDMNWGTIEYKIEHIMNFLIMMVNKQVLVPILTGIELIG